MHQHFVTDNCLFIAAAVCVNDGLCVATCDGDGAIKYASLSWN